jgi:hypothetical protein
VLLLIDYCGEGPIDAIVARQLISAVGGTPGADYVARRHPRGKDALDKRVAGLVERAKGGHRVLVLRDLDCEPCAGLLVQRLVQQAPRTFCLRIAVRAVEAWLLADRRGVARGLQTTPDRVPNNPDLLPDPKASLRELAARSASPTIRDRARQTPQAFGGLVAEIIHDHWDPRRAAANSPSLANALSRVRALCHED